MGDSVREWDVVDGGVLGATIGCEECSGSGVVFRPYVRPSDAAMGAALLASGRSFVECDGAAPGQFADVDHLNAWVAQRGWAVRFG